MLSFIYLIPDVIWSGVIASLLTLSGVMLSNKSNTKRLMLQLQHLSTENDKQRKTELRKEIYLGVAEQLVKANAYLSSLPQADFTNIGVNNSTQNFFSAAAKLQVVCETSTAKLVGDLVVTFEEIIIKALSMVRPIHDIQTQIVIREKHYEKTQSEIARILAEMTQFNESANKNIEIFEALKASYENQQQQASTVSTELTELWREKNKHTVEFTKHLLNEMKILAERSIYVLVAIRNELDVGGDIKVFITQMEKQRERSLTALNSFLDSLDNN